MIEQIEPVSRASLSAVYRFIVPNVCLPRRACGCLGCRQLGPIQWGNDPSCGRKTICLESDSELVHLKCINFKEMHGNQGGASTVAAHASGPGIYLLAFGGPSHQPSHMLPMRGQSSHPLNRIICFEMKQGTPAGSICCVGTEPTCFEA